MKHIAILGATGSIGTQALEMVQAFPEEFAVEVLTARHNADLLIQQSLHFKPNAVVIEEENLYRKVADALQPHDIKVFAGSQSIVDIVEMSSIDMVLVAVSGYAGLRPTYNALQHDKPIALANKETLVVGGSVITRLAAERHLPILPVDSEHSAIFQCLQGELHNPVEKLILTASGGPFLGRKKEDLQNIRPADALKHPNWKMGSKVTIDSATLMNKGLEMMEAHWLFQVPVEDIEVVVHPQSIVHSMVEFSDHSVKAQLGVPDMRLPIVYALSYPYRLPNRLQSLSFKEWHTLTFQEPDEETFRCLPIAYEVMRKGGNAPCCMNAANEVAVAAFLQEKISFLQIPELIEKVLAKASFIAQPEMGDFVRSDKESRMIATEIIQQLSL